MLLSHSAFPSLSKSAPYIQLTGIPTWKLHTRALTKNMYSWIKKLKQRDCQLSASVGYINKILF